MAKCELCGRELSGFGFGRRICEWCRQHEAAQRGEESPNQPLMAVPWKSGGASMPMLATQLLFGINVAVYIAMVLSGASPTDPNGAALLHWGANVSSFTLTGDWWRLLTSCFVHIGLFHLAMNMWCLWNLGELAEQLYGRITFLLIYLVCGLGGSLASLWWHSQPTLSAGASGAIFGLAGAVIASTHLGEFSNRVMARSVMRSLLFFVGFNVLLGLGLGIADNACHIGGLVAGVLMGAGIARLAPHPRLLPRLLIVSGVAALLVFAAHTLQQKRGYQLNLARASEESSNGNTAGAIKAYQAAARLRPEKAAQLHIAIAYLYQEQKDLASAEREFRAAAQSDESALYLLGDVQRKQGHAAEAEASYQQLLARNPRSTLAHLGFGYLARDRGLLDAALGEYRKAAELDPSDSSPLAGMGEVFARQRKYDEALAAYQKAITLPGGDDSETESALASLYDAKGMKAEAESARKRAQQLKSEED
jgi:rhomboid protease GluP